MRQVGLKFKISFPTGDITFQEAYRYSLFSEKPLKKWEWLSVLAFQTGNFTKILCFFETVCQIFVVFIGNICYIRVCWVSGTHDTAHRSAWFSSKALKDARCAYIDKSSKKATVKSLLTSSINTTLKSLLKRGYHGTSETFSFTFSCLSDFLEKCRLQHYD